MSSLGVFFSQSPAQFIECFVEIARLVKAVTNYDGIWKLGLGNVHERFPKIATYRFYLLTKRLALYDNTVKMSDKRFFLPITQYVNGITRI